MHDLSGKKQGPATHGDTITRNPTDMENYFDSLSATFAIFLARVAILTAA
jgi:hypothetical protein